MTKPSGFSAKDYLPQAWLSEVTTLRVDEPGAVAQEAATRQRRQRLAPNGRLVILAADHPARHINNVGADRLRMGDRREYLARIARVLECPAVDGLMATPDIIDDLFLLNRLLVAAGGPDLLAGRLLIGSMNRGGLGGAAWELNDPFTAYTPESITAQRLDGGKQLLRINLDEPDSLPTMVACAEVVTALSRAGLPSFLEPLPVARNAAGRWTVVRTADALIPIIGVAQALAETSAYTWLKLPASPDFERVAAATTMPILLLGGEPTGQPADLLHELHGCLQAGDNVRGLLIGRNILFPGDYDPYQAALAACSLVHDGDVDKAVELLTAPGPATTLFHNPPAAVALQS